MIPLGTTGSGGNSWELKNHTPIASFDACPLSLFRGLLAQLDVLNKTNLATRRRPLVLGILSKDNDDENEKPIVLHALHVRVNFSF